VIWILLSTVLFVFTGLAAHQWGLFSKYINPWLVDHATLLGAYRSLVAFIGFPLVILGGVYTYVQVLDRLERPDVGLVFYQPKSTTVTVSNLSQTVVRDPMYHVALFNLDSPPEERSKPLPIPVNGGNYIRVGERWGPNSMISIPSVKRLVHDGNRLLGWAWVTCPDCPKRFYWVYIKHGDGGWFSEMQPDQYPDMAGLVKLLQSSDAVAIFHKNVPIEMRVAILRRSQMTSVERRLKNRDGDK